MEDHPRVGALGTENIICCTVSFRELAMLDEGDVRHAD
jgi:hypothetical protein